MNETYEPGQRVYVLNEGPATVISDEGFGRWGRRVTDLGVTVRIDSDGAEVQAAHAQVTKEVM